MTSEDILREIDAMIAAAQSNMDKCVAMQDQRAINATQAMLNELMTIKETF